LVLTIPKRRIEKTVASDISDSIQVVDADESPEAVAYKRARKEPEDMRVHDAAAKEVRKVRVSKLPIWIS
jgi:hypothetical protein